MIKNNIYNNFRVGNYVQKPGGAIYVIEKIIDSGSRLKIRINNLIKEQETEIVEKYQVCGIKLMPEHMLSFRFKVEEGVFNQENSYDLRHNGKNSGYSYKIYDRHPLSWTSLPNLDEPKSKYLPRKAFLINETIPIPIDWEKIDKYVENGSLIPMDFLHTLQNYVEDNKLSFLNFDYSCIVSKKN